LNGPNPEKEFPKPNLQGKVVAKFGRWGNYDGQFMMAHDIALSPNGDIRVGDIHGQRIQKNAMEVPSSSPKLPFSK